MNTDQWTPWLLHQLGDEEVYTADGYEDAFLGICTSPCHPQPVVAYDYDKCILVLMERDGMTYEDAVEFFSFNTMGSYVGPTTPHYITLYQEEE